MNTPSSYTFLGAKTIIKKKMYVTSNLSVWSGLFIINSFMNSFIINVVHKAQSFFKISRLELNSNFGWKKQLIKIMNQRISQAY